MTFDYLFHGILGRPYRLHVRHSGNPNKPVVVLLHGIAASGEDWRKVLPFLEQDYQCITIDLLGFGESPKPAWCEYTMKDHMRSLYHTMNKLRLKQQFILAGHSLGSLLAARYASEHEANLSRLLLLSPPVYPPLTQIKKTRVRKMTGLLLAIYRFLHENPRVTPDTFRRLCYIAPLPRSIINNPDTWIPFMRTLKQCIETQTILQDTGGLHLPVDIFYGSLDQVVLGPNVKLLARTNVRLHPFLNNHDLTARYGKKLAEVLAAEA